MTEVVRFCGVYDTSVGGTTPFPGVTCKSLWSYLLFIVFIGLLMKFSIPLFASPRALPPLLDTSSHSHPLCLLTFYTFYSTLPRPRQRLRKVACGANETYTNLTSLPFCVSPPPADCLSLDRLGLGGWSGQNNLAPLFKRLGFWFLFGSRRV